MQIRSAKVSYPLQPIMDAIGNISILSFTFGVFLTGLSFLAKQHCHTQHPQSDYFGRVSKFQFILSSISLASMTTAVLMIMLSYYSPTVSGTCLCHHMFITSITCYVIGFYAIKLCFVVHCHLVYQVYVNTRVNNSFNTDDWTEVSVFTLFDSKIPISLAFCSVCTAATRSVLVAHFSKGDCLEHSNYGCHVDWSPFLGYITLAIVFIDAVMMLALLVFVYKKLRSLDASHKELTEQHGMHAVCLFIPIICSLTDISINTASENKYESLVFFLADCFVCLACIFAAFSPAHRYVKGSCSVFVPSVTRLLDRIEENKMSKEADHAVVIVLPDRDFKTEAMDLTDAPESTVDMESGHIITNNALGIPHNDEVPNILSNTLTELHSSELATEGMVLRCPRCYEEVIVRDGDDKWERLTMHIIAFHLDDVD